MTSTENMKAYIKNIGKAHLVKELVEGGWEIEAALEWVFDMNTLTKTKFLLKYFH